MEIPLFPLHTVLCPGIVLPLHVFEDALSRADPPLPRHRRAVRGRPDPGRPRGRRPRRHWRWPASGRSSEIREAGPLSGRPLRPARRGHRPVRDRVRRPGARAVPRRRRHAARGRGRRRGAGRAPGRLGHPPVRPLSRADAGPRRARPARCSTSGSRSTATAVARRRGRRRRRSTTRRSTRGSEAADAASAEDDDRWPRRRVADRVATW